MGGRIRQWLPTSVSHVSPEPATHEDLVKLARAIVDSSDFASRIADLSKNLAIEEMRSMLLRDVKPHLYELGGRLDEIKGSLMGIDKDMAALLDYCAHNVSYQILQNVRRRVPEGIQEYHEQTHVTEAWIREQAGMANEYIMHVWMELGTTRWSEALRSVLEHGQAEGERYVSNMPEEKRPPGIDPLEFRQYALAITKYAYLTRFLEATAEEEEEGLKAYSEELSGRLRNRAE